jgi:hypothetical protein
MICKLKKIRELNFQIRKKSFYVGKSRKGNKNRQGFALNSTGGRIFNPDFWQRESQDW